jgi:S-formylglutathione hydrolase
MWWDFREPVLMTSNLIRDVVGDVPYVVLTPENWTRDEKLPLVLVLHGANSSGDVLAMLQPFIDETFPRTVFACASTPTVGGFYLGEWETFVGLVFPRFLAEEYGIDSDRISLLGSSMGGYGVLKIAFAEPARWLSVAAVAPALLTSSPRPRNTLAVLAQLAQEMAADPASSVFDRLRANADEIRASGLPIFLRCGDLDVFKMHDGTERLHRALWDLDIGHDYHLVYGADHVGPEALSALRAALAFTAAVLRGPVDGGAAEVRAMLEPALREAERQDPTAARRYGLM